jgi:hypothetical protein
LDVSGNAEFTQDLSMGGRLLIGLDASFNSRVLVASDVSLGGRLFVAGNTELSGNLLIKGNLAVQQYQSQNIINTTTTNYQLIISEDLSLNGRLFASGDVSLNGNVNISRVLRPTTISEPFITNTGTTSPYTFDYNQGATFYVTSPPAANFTVNITNVPTDINRTYCFTIIISSVTNKRFCNLLQINSSGTNITPYFANGSPSTITSGTYITQTFSLQRISTGETSTNVNVFSSVTSWF